MVNKGEDITVTSLLCGLTVLLIYAIWFIVIKFFEYCPPEKRQSIWEAL